MENPNSTQCNKSNKIRVDHESKVALFYKFSLRKLFGMLNLGGTSEDLESVWLHEAKRHRPDPRSWAVCLVPKNAVWAGRRSRPRAFRGEQLSLTDLPRWPVRPN